MRFAAELIARLKAGGVSLATVESCTGGLISSRITDVPGASDVFWGGWCVYDNSAKAALGVPIGLIRERGAVSQEVAVQLAECGLREASKHVTQPVLVIATTGIAGPGGATPTKPVGLCFLAVARTGAKTAERTLQAPAGTSREQNKAFFADEALRLALELL